MSANFHTVRLCKANDCIALAEVECAFVPSNDPPLHLILSLNHIEFARQGGRVGRLGKQRGTDGGAPQQVGSGGGRAQEKGSGCRGCGQSQNQDAKLLPRNKHGLPFRRVWFVPNTLSPAENPVNS